MTTPFDPYHRWLGIRPEEQPADHYRLLGLARFEDDIEVIRDAAERQMSHVRRYATGEHAEDAKRILNELGGAKACLIVQDEKLAYDATLQAGVVVERGVGHAAGTPEVDLLTSSTAAPIPLEIVEPSLGLVVSTPDVDDPLQRTPQPTTPAYSTAPTPARRRPKTLAQMQSLRQPQQSVASSVRLGVGQVDDLLKRIAGDDNALLHGFLRVFAIAVAIVFPVVCLLAAGSWAIHWSSDAGETVASPSVTVASPNPTPPTPALTPTLPPPLESRITNSIGMELALIPGGEFLMGSPPGEADRGNDEQQHHVRITQPFYMGTTEVTQGQWQAVMKTTLWKYQMFVKEGSGYPATAVSWEDAVEFCRRLSAAESRTYRLPTEAGWEYACRAGSTTSYCFGDDATSLKDYAWFDGNAWNVNEQYAHRVRQNRANAYGLFDMHGNVWEWCSDWYDADYYSKSPSSDPPGATTGSYRVLRGGGWRDAPRLCRSAFRLRYSPSYRDYDLGFRVSSSVLSEPNK